MGYEVEVRSIVGAVTAVGSAGPFTVVIDRPVEVGGGGLGFNGGELLHLAVAGCVSNDLFHEATARGVELTRVVVRADGDYGGDPAVSTGISYTVELEGRAAEDVLRSLVEHVDAVAEIPNSLRGGTPVRLGEVTVARGS